MGGPGSGNRYRDGTKVTVEDALSVSVRLLRGRLFAGAAGTLTWARPGERAASVAYTVAWAEAAPVVTLTYQFQGTAPVQVPVRMQTTEPGFGGRRWWFTCPLAVNGVACRRRAGKLHLPPGGRYFGCRVCHELTYRSCQEAHQGERAFGRLGFPPEVVRSYLKRTRGRG